MKRFILFLLAFVLVSGLAGCREKPVPGGETNKSEVQTEARELTELKDRIKADGKLIGVAYLGWIEGDTETACKDLAGLDYTKDLPFIKGIEKYAENEGYRMYLVVPADDSIAGYLNIFLASDYGYHLITRHTYGAVIDEIDDTHVSRIPIPLLKNQDIQLQINALALEANEKRYEAYKLEQKALEIMDKEIIYAK